MELMVILPTFMKGLILAGGTGSRLFPVTHTGPKQLIPVANRPVLEYAVRDFREAGIDEIGIILGTKGREEIQEYFGDGSEWDVDITYIVQGEPLGLAHAVGCGREFVSGDSFVVYLGDVMVEEGIEGLVEGFEESEEVVRMGVQRVENPSRYGVLQVDDEHRVEAIVEKPDDPKSDLAAVGIGAFSPRIFEEIEELEPSWRGELELSDANQRLVERGETVRAYVFENWWKDTGTPEDMLEANRLVLDGARTDERGLVAVGDRSVVEEDATIHGPVSVGDDVTIRAGSEVGPYVSVGEGCTVEGATVENSILVADCTVSTSRHLTDSLLGRGVVVEDEESAGTSLVVADDTQVGF